MYFDSDSQEQAFKVILKSMAGSQVRSVLKVQMSISHPGLTWSTVLSSVPVLCGSLRLHSLATVTLSTLPSGT